MNHVNSINSSNDDDSQRLEQDNKPEYKYLVSNCCGVQSYWDVVGGDKDRCPKCREHCDFVYEDER